MQAHAVLMTVVRQFHFMDAFERLFIAQHFALRA